MRLEMRNISHTVNPACRQAGVNRQPMRTLQEIKKIFTDQARADERIQAVLLQGSRANSNIIPDPYQDFDICLVVNQMESFLIDHSWTRLYGDKIAWQLPDLMGVVDQEPARKVPFHYLMLFNDGTRIDLSLFPVEKMKTDFKPDSLTVVWVDKEGLFNNIASSSDRDYLICKPSEKEFQDCCNEFWWVSTNISKGLLRNEITLAKAMMEGPVREMFLQIVQWYIGTNTNFSVSLGKSGRFIKNYLKAQEYNDILTTYPDHRSENIWNSLFQMTDLFSLYATLVSTKMGYMYNLEEQENVKKLLFRQYEERIK
jgi:aminoglycoside 6-adenylyltransferase